VLPVEAFEVEDVVEVPLLESEPTEVGNRDSRFQWRLCSGRCCLNAWSKSGKAGWEAKEEGAE
jgi:hypothetical protein